MIVPPQSVVTALRRLFTIPQLADVRWAIPFRHRGKTLLWHAELACSAQRCCILLDYSGDSILQWQPHLHYLRERAKRGQAVPTLLLLCPTHFRAESVLRLAATLGVSTSIFASTQYERGLHNGEWLAWRDGAVHATDPFTLLSKEVEAKSNSRPWRNNSAAAYPPSPLCDLSHPAWIVFKTLIQTPACLPRAIAVFSNLSLELVQGVLAELRQSNFAHGGGLGLEQPISKPIQRSNPPISVASIDQYLWSVTDEGLHGWITEQMLPPSTVAKYRFFRADHQRRAQHTSVAYGFFQSLIELCQQRNRAIGVLADGRAPYVLAEFESELRASDWYRGPRRGDVNYWRPDGYGALRAGDTTTRFWIEIDGTAQAPSRHSPIVWERKMMGLCDYLLSERWTFRYETQPSMLIITTDYRNRPLICDVLHFTARARGLKPPQVFMATQAALAQRGPLAPIWFDLTCNEDQPTHAFVGLDQPLDLAKRLNMIDMVQHWQ